METPKLEKVITVFASKAAQAEAGRAYWWSKTPEERFEAAEIIRKLTYPGYETEQPMIRVARMFKRIPR